jgi:hypothetical protein
MVNSFSEQLGLGKKVNAADWTDNAQDMLASIRPIVARYI